MATTTRTGFGYDVHRLVPGRKCILGGVEIPHTTGFYGHSDADVLLHAIADALLGAAALGDIGKHFPNTDPRYKGISSVVLLTQVAELLTQHRYTVVNVDATVILDAPKIAPYVDRMRNEIANALGVAVGQISVKATTSEGLGFIGGGEGGAAHAVAVIAQR
jgi:2-C-methyl-D-erythritol 2,4-cyclodiphosphate synthase